MDLIDRDALLKALGEPHTLDYNAIATQEKIKKQPTVDAAPVVHGRWENGHCSRCGEDIAGRLDTWTNVQNFAYCPNCSAKMDGGDADADSTS